MKALTEGYNLQWMDKAQVKGERIKQAEELPFCETRRLSVFWFNPLSFPFSLMTSVRK